MSRQHRGGIAPPEMKTPAAARRQGSSDGADAKAGDRENIKSDSDAQHRARRAQQTPVRLIDERVDIATRVGRSLARAFPSTATSAALHAELEACGIAVDLCRPGRPFQPSLTRARLIFLLGLRSENFGPGHFSAKTLRAALSEASVIAIPVGDLRAAILAACCRSAARGEIVAVIETSAVRVAEWRRFIVGKFPYALPLIGDLPGASRQRSAA